MKNSEKVDLDWGKLGFSYIKTDKRYFSRWKNGEWTEKGLVEDNTFTIHEGSTVLHYAQTSFEGLKAQTAKDGRIIIFRPDENAKRLQNSADHILMPRVPIDMFVDACRNVVEANYRWVPPYGSGASFYIRPFLFGVGENLGVKSAPEFIFSIHGVPVGPYFKGGLSPVSFIVLDYDRAAPNGTGSSKVGGNYAASLLAHEKAVKEGFADCMYLDPATHTKIEEAGAANFFGITADNKFVTPKSESILPSITKHSLMHIAEHYLGLKIEQRDVPIDSIYEFVEAGACGTAAVITPIGGISNNGKMHNFYNNGKSAGPVTTKLYEILTSIQKGDMDAPKGWISAVKVR